MRFLALASISLLTAGLAGCTTGTPTGDGRDCIEVPAAIMERIAEGANAAPIAPIAAGAVRSEAFADASIVAMSFEIDGDTETGVWAVGGTFNNPGVTLSIDAMAATVTDWPNEMNGEKFSITEDGATEAISCLNAL